MYKFVIDNVVLPVAPEKVDIKIKSQNKSISTANGHEINIINTPGLTEIEFQALLPNVKYAFADYSSPYTNGDFLPASYYLSHFEKLMLNKEPFTFFIVRKTEQGGTYSAACNMKVSLEGYTITEDANSAPDVLVQISLKQYRPYTLEKRSVGNSIDNPKISSANKTNKGPKPYVVKKGDTLWGICKRILGDGSKYKQVAKLNHIANPNRIYPGQVIKFV